MDHREYVQIGDYVSAEYVTGISGAVGRLSGIVIGVGEWEGQRTTSVAGVDSDGNVSCTMQSTLPVLGISSRDTAIAREAWRRVHAATTSDRLRAKLERIWVEEMGM